VIQALLLHLSYSAPHPVLGFPTGLYPVGSEGRIQYIWWISWGQGPSLPGQSGRPRCRSLTVVLLSLSYPWVCLLLWLFDRILPRGSRASIVMDSMRGMQSRAQGADSFSRGIRDGVREGSEPSDLSGDPPHVEGRERLSTRVRGTASDLEGDEREFLFPPPFARATRVEQESPLECRSFLVGGNKQSRPKHRGLRTVRPGGVGPWVYPLHPHKSMGLGLRKEAERGTTFRRPYETRWMLPLARYIVGSRAHRISAASHCTSAAFRRPSHSRKLRTTGLQMSSYASPDAWILCKAMSSF